MSSDETGAAPRTAPQESGDIAEGTSHGAPAQGACCGGKFWTRAALLGALVLIPLIALQVPAVRRHWTAAWQQGSLFPEHLSGGGANQEGGLFAQFREPRGPAFDLRKATVPREEIRNGGPPKDGIPALNSPKFLAGSEADYMRADDRVIGVTHESQSRAYPLKVLNYHEIVNDRLGNLPIAVTYCPLCDSAAVFDRRTPLGEREFGVSGMLYNSNVLMYDRGGEPESLWSQMKTQGVSGPAADKSLVALPLELTTWQDWLDRYPDTEVVSPETGHMLDYRASPYGGYFDTPELMFPAQPTSDQLPTKARVLGVWTDGASRAYPLSAFGSEATEIEDKLAGRTVRIAFNPDANSLRIVDADEGVHWVYSLWFAWYAFRPETDVFVPQGAE